MPTLEERFAAWKDKRACGTCTACCFVFEVPEVPTPAYAWCKHCTPGVGCEIYRDRPTDCSAFHCCWRVGFGTDDDRPDRHGVVMDLQSEDGAVVLRVWRPKQLQARKLKSAIRMQGEIVKALTADGYTVRRELHGPAR